MSEKLSKETEGIALWCLEGLKRLVANEFHFTFSDRTVQNQAEMRKDEDSIMDFFESDGYVTFDVDAICITKDLYDAYLLWSEGNLIKPRSESSFSREVKQRAGKLGIAYLKNASIDGKTARGYKGIYANHVVVDAMGIQIVVEAVPVPYEEEVMTDYCNRVYSGSMKNSA